MADFNTEIEELQAESLKQLEADIASKSVKPLEENEVLKKYQEKLAELRADSSKKAEASALAKKAVAFANILSDAYIKQVNEEQSAKEKEIREKYAARVLEIKGATAARVAQLSKKEEINVAKYEGNSALFDAKNKFQNEVAKCRSAKNQAYIDHVMFNRVLRDGRTNLKENMTMNWKNYINNFKMSKFMLDNGLYIAILVFFIVCVIIAPLMGNGALLSLPNILTILEQSSTRMFYALGVAGLILIAGTDLSVCRMVALGAVTTGLILHPSKNIVSFFGMEPWDFTGLPMGLRLVMALFLSISLCVLFSSFSGFFSAKFKIHPFISTLSAQLIIYGLLFFGTSGTPVGSIDPGIKDLIGGRWILFEFDGELITFPKLIIPAVIAIFVAWFIWNKTTFGKNMYAVGGNAEAAAVSGINVFGVTMGIFIMAGIFYGCGAFLEAFRANASAGTGQGFELDAIAACVVGGISFNGGIGRIRGAVIGVIIFTGLTYCLTFLGIDTNLQFVFKGLILIAAVALDSVKYLKRK